MNSLALVTATPSQASCEVVACPQWYHAHSWLVLELDTICGADTSYEYISLSNVTVSNYSTVPIVSRTQPTVPSPPQQITLKFSTSLNICRPCIGPPTAKLCTCRGFKMYWNFLSIRSPCLPPDFGLMNTRRGREPGGGVIWKDIAGC